MLLYVIINIMKSFEFVEEKMVTKVFNSKYLNDTNNDDSERFTLEDYNNYRTLFVQSTTGTGKTHTIMEHIKDDLEQGKTLLSIFGKQSLGKTILNYFKKFHKNHDINHYEIHRKTFANNFKTSNSFLCVNSLRKILGNEDMTAKVIKKLVENKIVYIDEISIFISETINNTKINNLFEVYSILKHILKYAYKVIVSQSEISEPVFYLLSERTEAQYNLFNMSLYIVNKHKKKNIPAYKVASKDVFFNQMIQNYKKGENFLVGSDSCKRITELYERFIAECSDKDREVYLFTRDTPKIDENFKFEGKIVFYSPSIICGVDCTLSKEQDQFFYFQGNSISAELIYQQACRTRNMRNLYFYVNEKHTDTDLHYESIDDCIDKIKRTKNKLIKAFNIDCDQREIAEDFFNLYCKEEYHLDKYRNLKLTHFYKLLKKDGFILKENNASPTTSYFSESIVKNKVIRDYSDLENWMNKKEQNENFDKIKEILNIDDNETIINNKDMFLDANALERHLTVSSLMHNHYSSEFKLKTYKNKNFIEKLIGSKIAKITYLKKLEEKYEIKIFTKSGKVEYTESDMTMTDYEIKEMKTILNSRKVKEITKKSYLVSMIMEFYRNLGFEKNIVSHKSNGKYKYSLNEDFISDTLELLYFRLNDSNRLQDECVNKFLQIQERENKKKGIEAHDAFFDMVQEQ